MYDVIIVGAGPVGLYTAGLLESRLKVLVIESKEKLGTKACSGLYSTKLAGFVDIKKDFVEHKVKSALLHSPNGAVVKLEKKETTAFVVDRGLFEKYLAKRVKSKIMIKTRVTKIDVQKENVIVYTNRGEFKAKMVIGCDGANSVVRKNFGVQPKEIVNGLIAIVEKKDLSDFVDMWFDKELISDGFFWKIPRGHTIEYGALGNKITFRDLEKFFGLKNYEKKAAFIPIGPCKSYFERTLLIGDAAGITKPWSGGGLIFGFTCANIARDIIFKAFDKNDFSEKFLKAYEKLWKEKIGKSIKFGLFARGIYKHMNNGQVNMAFGKMKYMKKLSGLDMDFPSLEEIS